MERAEQVGRLLSMARKAEKIALYHALCMYRIMWLLL